jgi:hypothetical protein
MELLCPYCGEKKPVKLPSEKSVAVAVCLSCGEIIVIYKQHAVALDREVLASGSTDEKRQHIAAMIMEFAQKETGQVSEDILPKDLTSGQAEGSNDFCMEFLDTDRSTDETPISAREIADFRRIDLNLIDNAAYFGHVFGGTS